MDTDNFSFLFKLLLVGDSGVGKSCLLMRFTQDKFDDLSPTIGVDFKLKFMTVNGQRLKLTIWDTAGQERFRTLTSSYYRGAHGIIFAYDVTRRTTFDSIAEVWMKEVDMYSTVDDAVKMVVGNKIDMEGRRTVTREEGQRFAREHGCLFVETSAKEDIAVSQAFEELVQQIMQTPTILEEEGGVSLNIKPGGQKSGGCSC